MRKTSLIFLFLLIFTLAACDESLYGPGEPPPVVFDDAEQPPEVLPSQTTQPVDGQIVGATASETALPDNALPQWAADFIPDKFPDAEFTSITEIRNHNFKLSKGLSIDCLMSTAQYKAYGQALIDNGFNHMSLEAIRNIYLSDINYSDINYDCYYIDGYNCYLYKNSFDKATDLHSLTVDISWQRHDPTEGRGWPPVDTDLGLEEITFTKWPRDYLPDGFPEPVAVNIISMEQKTNGMFITFYASINDIAFYNAQLKKIDYKKSGTQGSRHPDAHKNPMHNQNLDRYYFTAEFNDVLSEAQNNSIDKFTEDDFTELLGEWRYKDQYITYHIIRGDDTKRYWESIE